MASNHGIKSVTNVIYFNAILYNAEKIERIDEKLQPFFGLPVITTEEFFFNHTDYYNKEMGDHLVKYFAAYDIIKSPSSLPQYKIMLLDFEEKYMEGHSRVVNVDIGYLALEKIVVASTKNFSHRLYIGEDIYGDLQLIRKNEKYNSLPWTYKDYKQDFVINFFENLRQVLLKSK
jgi:hypothetical protein